MSKLSRSSPALLLSEVDALLARGEPMERDEWVQLARQTAVSQGLPASFSKDVYNTAWSFNAARCAHVLDRTDLDALPPFRDLSSTLAMVLRQVPQNEQACVNQEILVGLLLSYDAPIRDAWSFMVNTDEMIVDQNLDPYLLKPLPASKQARTFRLFKRLLDSDQPFHKPLSHLAPVPTVWHALATVEAPWPTPLIQRMAEQHYHTERNDQDKNGNTALHLAAAGANTELVNVLIGPEATEEAVLNKKWQAPIHTAAAQGSAEVVGLLLKSNPDLLYRTWYNPTVKKTGGYPPMDHTLTTSALGAFPVGIAAFHGNISALSVLVDQIEDVNDPDLGYGATPLHWATFAMQTDAVRLLLDKGADPTVRNGAGQSSIDLLPVNLSSRVQVTCKATIERLFEAHALRTSIDAESSVLAPAKARSRL